MGYGMLGSLTEVPTCRYRYRSLYYIVYTFSPPTIQSSHVAIAMYLTLCAMLLRCFAMCLLGGGCELRWIAEVRYV